MLDDPAGILNNIMASMGDGLSIQDLNMRIVYQNKFMKDAFGSHIGDHCYKIYEHRDSACEKCPIIQAYQTGQVTKALRVGITKEGNRFRFENIASVLRDSKGEIVAGIELCRIVEDRETALDDLKDTLEELKQTQGALIRAEKMAGISHLAAGIAHEINTPTMFVMSNLYTMRDYITEFLDSVDAMEKIVNDVALPDNGTKDVRYALQNVIDAEDYRYLKSDMPQAIEESLNGLERIKSIVSGVLKFASASDSERLMVDVNGELESALSLLADDIRSKGRAVKTLGDLPRTLANPQQMKQMFVSLISNAVQAIGAEGIITLETGTEDNHIRIMISDNGGGIPADVMQNIFNPFFTTREVGKGEGLGLSIAYRIIENHNGSIDVQSESGSGTTVTIRLPVISE